MKRMILFLGSVALLGAFAACGDESAKQSASASPTVTCKACGYYPRASWCPALFLKSINETTGEVKLEGRASDGSNMPRDYLKFWTYRDGTLYYEREGVRRYTLAVRENDLHGSYEDLNAKEHSRNPYTFKCDSSPKRVIIKD